MNKHYLTIGQSRIYTLDNPIGDAFGGAAYGERRMPVAAVAMAAGSFAAGATAFAAATTTLGAIAAGATMIGSALTIIGTVTGNAKLAKIGGVLSIGGMVGTGLINHAAKNAAASAGAAEAGTALAEGGAVNEAAGIADAVADTGATGIAGAPTAGTDLAVDSMQSAGPMTDIQAQGLIDRVPPTVADTATGLQQQIGSDASNAMVAQAPNTLSTAGTGVEQSLQGSAFDPEMNKLLRQQELVQQGQGGFFDKFGRWVKDNKELVQLGGEGLKAVGALLPSDKAKAEAEYYKTKSEETRRRALWASGRTA
jgi:hypothetical protein